MAVTGGLGGSQVFSGASGGKMYAFNNITSGNLITVAPANPSRQKLVFHNPGANDIYVGPATLASGALNQFTTAALGGTFLVVANGGTFTVVGECQTAWNAIAATGTTNPFSVMDSNVA